MYIHEAETDNNVDVVVALIVIKSLTLLIYLIYTNTKLQYTFMESHRKRKTIGKTKLVQYYHLWFNLRPAQFKK